MPVKRHFGVAAVAVCFTALPLIPLPISCNDVHMRSSTKLPPLDFLSLGALETTLH